MFQNIQGQAVQEEYEETDYKANKEYKVKKFLKVAFTPRKIVSIYSKFYAI